MFDCDPEDKLARTEFICRSISTCPASARIKTCTGCDGTVIAGNVASPLASELIVTIDDSRVTGSEVCVVVTSPVVTGAVVVAA